MFGKRKPTPDIEIVPAQKTDLKGFHDLFFEFQNHHYRARKDIFLDPKRIILDMHSFVETISAPNRLVLLAKSGNLVVGMLMITISAIEVGSLQHPRKRPTVDMIVTRPKYRRSGIAEQLFKEGCKWVKNHGYSEIVCEVWDFSQGAKDYFTKLGFKPLAHRLSKKI